MSQQPNISEVALNYLILLADELDFETSDDHDDFVVNGLTIIRHARQGELPRHLLKVLGVIEDRDPGDETP